MLTVMNTFIRFFLLLAVVAVLVMTGCGGGFRNDSPNAVEIEDPVFGGDTL